MDFEGGGKSDFTYQLPSQNPELSKLVEFIGSDYRPVRKKDRWYPKT